MSEYISKLVSQVKAGYCVALVEVLDAFCLHGFSFLLD